MERDEKYGVCKESGIDASPICRRMASVLLARNNMEGSSQALYKRFIDMKVSEGKAVLDFTEPNLREATGLTDYFFINAKNNVTLSADSSVDIEADKIYEDYTTYKITRKKPYSPYAVLIINSR
jgi:hypothetical protein